MKEISQFLIIELNRDDLSLNSVFYDYSNSKFKFTPKIKIQYFLNHNLYLKDINVYFNAIEFFIKFGNMKRFNFLLFDSHRLFQNKLAFNKLLSLDSPPFYLFPQNLLTEKIVIDLFNRGVNVSIELIPKDLITEKLLFLFIEHERNYYFILNHELCSKRIVVKIFNELIKNNKYDSNYFKHVRKSLMNQEIVEIYSRVMFSRINLIDKKFLNKTIVDNFINSYTINLFDTPKKYLTEKMIDKMFEYNAPLNKVSKKYLTEKRLNNYLLHNSSIDLSFVSQDLIDKKLIKQCLKLKIEILNFHLIPNYLMSQKLMNYLQSKSDHFNNIIDKKYLTQKTVNHFIINKVLMNKRIDIDEIPYKFRLHHIRCFGNNGFQWYSLTRFN